MDKRIYNFNMKINESEKEELSRMMQKYQKSASDLIRIAIRHTFGTSEFEESYNNTIFRSGRKSIF